MKLRDLFRGTPVTPKRTPTPEWHPLDELDDDYPAKPWLDPATYEPLAAEARAELDDDVDSGVAAGAQGRPRAAGKSVSNSDRPSPAAQCTAPTKIGRPCSKPPRPGSDRCNLPAHQRT